MRGGAAQMIDSSFENVKHIDASCHKNPWADELDWEEKRDTWRDCPRPAVFPEHLRWAGHHLGQLEAWVNEGQECHNCPDNGWCDPEWYQTIPCPNRR